MIYSIYKLTAPDGKVYIGCTNDKVEYRFNNGMGYVHHCSNRSAIAKSIVYHGWKNFKQEVLETTDNEEKAGMLEKYYIEKYNSTDSRYGLNTATGGKRDFTFNKEYKRDVKGIRRSIATEFKKGMIPHNRHPIVCLDNGKTYQCIKEAEIDLGTPLNHIYEVCIGKRKKTNGYRFVYLENYRRENNG